METEKPYDCCWCKKKNVQDVMVTAGVVSRDEAICSECKIKFGNKMMSGFDVDRGRIERSEVIP